MAYARAFGDDLARPPGLLVSAHVCTLGEEADGVARVWAEPVFAERRQKGLIALAAYLGLAVVVGYAVERGASR